MHEFLETHMNGAVDIVDVAQKATSLEEQRPGVATTESDKGS